MSLRNLIGNSYRFSSRSIISCMLRNRFRSFHLGARRLFAKIRTICPFALGRYCDKSGKQRR